MVEGGVCKITTPLGGDTDTEEGSGDNVAKLLPQCEAGVGQLPDTVDTVGTIRLSQHIFEVTLQNFQLNTT